jgi:hypothetical protein
VKERCGEKWVSNSYMKIYVIVRDDRSRSFMLIINTYESLKYRATQDINFSVKGYTNLILKISK